jgi:hypothetical protein
MATVGTATIGMAGAIRIAATLGITVGAMATTVGAIIIILTITTVMAGATIIILTTIMAMVGMIHTIIIIIQTMAGTITTVGIITTMVGLVAMVQVERKILREHIMALVNQVVHPRPHLL